MRAKSNGVSINVDKIKTPKAKREKLFHISKRMGASTKFLVINRVVSVVTSLLVCALLFNVFAPNGFGTFFVSLFKALGINFNTGFNLPSFFNLLYDFAIILGISIALLPAFKMKFWNLGAEGQILMGVLGAGIVSRFLGPILPGFLTVILMILVAVIFGAIWAVIPAIFRAFFDTNETLFTLMMNYIAMGIVSFLVNLWDPGHGRFASLTNGTFRQICTGLPSWFPNLIVFIIVLLLAAFVFIYVKFTKHGYELSVVGESVNTAKYVGIDVKKTIIRTLIVSGALCGIVGWLILAGNTREVEMNTVGGRGFTGVLAAWLGHFDVLEIVIMSFLVAFVTKGSSLAATDGNVSDSFSKISIAVFFFVILAFEFFANYEIHLNHKNKLVMKINEAKEKKKASNEEPPIEVKEEVKEDK